MEEVKKMIDQHDAEVRAKAIDEFAKSLVDRLEEHERNQARYGSFYVADAYATLTSLVNQLAEQLKEGGK